MNDPTPGAWANDLDPGLMGRVVEASLADCDELLDQRNTLGVALRRVVLTPCMGCATIADHALPALEAVFPGDPLGEKGLYDCPTADGRDVMGEKLGEG